MTKSSKVAVKSGPVIALNKSVECPTTGAIVSCHKVAYYAVDLLNGKTTATLAGYVSEDAMKAGRTAISHVSVTAPGVPQLGFDPSEWIYAQFLDPEAAQEGNALAGCTAVYNTPGAATIPAES